MDITFLQSFGVDPGKFALQSAIYFIPAIWATFRVVRHQSGASLPLWLVLIWFLPVIGPVLALLLVRPDAKEYAAR